MMAINPGLHQASTHSETFPPLMLAGYIWILKNVFTQPTSKIKRFLKTGENSQVVTRYFQTGLLVKFRGPTVTTEILYGVPESSEDKVVLFVEIIE